MTSLFKLMIMKEELNYKYLVKFKDGSEIEFEDFDWIIVTDNLGPIPRLKGVSYIAPEEVIYVKKIIKQ